MSLDELIKQAQDGNTQALEELWERTKPFAFAVSRRFHTTVCVDADDFQQCAWLGFHTAVQKHEGRYHFLTLLEFCVRLECQKALHIRTSKRDPAMVSYDVPAPDGEQAMLDLFEDESLPESDAVLIGADLVRDVRAAVAELPKRERMLIELRWLGKEVRTLHAVGKRMRISTERVRQLEKRAFARLRDDPVLQTYAPWRNTSGNLKSGLSRFIDTRTSCVEQVALRGVQRSMNEKKRHAQKTAYADLLESLAAEGYLSSEELPALLGK